MLLMTNSKETAVSKFNQGAREMFKRKQDWTEERLRRLERPQGLPSLPHPAADQEKDSISTETDGDNQIEI
jgi:hypothetical protein